jgi:predicted esterase YcpF (UPF0227 family)
MKPLITPERARNYPLEAFPTITGLTEFIINSEKTTTLKGAEVVSHLETGSWKHWMHNTGDEIKDTSNAHTTLKEDCIRLAKELDHRLHQLTAVENTLQTITK